MHKWLKSSYTGFMQWQGSLSEALVVGRLLPGPGPGFAVCTPARLQRKLQGMADPAGPRTTMGGYNSPDRPRGRRPRKMSEVALSSPPPTAIMASSPA